MEMKMRYWQQSFPTEFEEKKYTAHYQNKVDMGNVPEWFFNCGEI